MSTQQNQISLRKIVLLVVVVVGCAFLTGCQTYPYSKVENEVFSYVDKLSRKMPKGFVGGEFEVEGATQMYHDSSLVMGDNIMIGGRGRFVWSKLNFGWKDLSAGYVDMDRWLQIKKAGLNKVKKDTFVAFGFRSFSGDEDDKDMLDYEVIALSTPRVIVLYVKKMGETEWRRCEQDLDIDFDSDMMSGAWEQCHAKKRVPTEQVQRYIDLSERFYKTYSLKRQLVPIEFTIVPKK